MSAGNTIRKVEAKAEFVVDSRGRRRKVLLDLNTYRAMLEELELKEDIEDMEKSIRETKREDFVDYRTAREDLKKSGKL